MNSPFTREEQAFARDVKRLANSIDKLIGLLEKYENNSKEDKL